MKRYLWSTNDGHGRLSSYVILECSEETAEEIELRDKRLSYEFKWKFIADKLHEIYFDKFPAWFNDYGRRYIFWYNNVLENYDEAYERIVEKRMNELKDNFENKDDLRYEAEWQVENELENLPVFVL